MAIAMRAAQDEPVADINTTPLIDVMLVLLIMFIITIPLQTHSVKVDLPQQQPSPQLPPPDAVKNQLGISEGGTVLWNGTPVDLIRLRQYLDITQRMSPIPELHIRPDAQAPYARVDEVMAVIKRAQVEKMGFVDNEKYSAAF